MNGVRERFRDLAPRVVSGGVLALAGLGALLMGGWWFVAIVTLAAALMVWELYRMLAPVPDGRIAAGLAVIAGAAALAGAVAPNGLVLLLAVVPAIAGVAPTGRNWRDYAGGAVAVMLACLALIHLREELGAVWLLWLVLIVITSDVAGYFAGRLIGGPRLWPRVSPKKTWSGTVAGWLGAVVIGLIFMRVTGAGAMLLPVSVALSIAGQFGDIAESALKRRAGVKDSSALIPGHGGVLDRFDAMLGAALALAAIAALLGFPQPSGG